MVLHMFLALLLLLIPAGALYYFDRSLLRTMGVAVVRMVVQLLVLCLIVWALVKYDKLWLSLLWLVLLACWPSVASNSPSPVSCCPSVLVFWSVLWS